VHEKDFKLQVPGVFGKLQALPVGEWYLGKTEKQVEKMLKSEIKCLCTEGRI